MSNELKTVKTLTINGIKYTLKGQLEAIKCGDTVVSADASGKADIHEMFSPSNAYLSSTISSNAEVQSKADASDLRYSIDSASTQLSDRTVNTVTVADSGVMLNFPQAVPGKTRDFMIMIDATGYTTGSLSINLPSGAKQYGDNFPSLTAQCEYLVAVTEISSNSFYVKSLELEEVE